jgi:hypothetical protein
MSVAARARCCGGGTYTAAEEREEREEEEEAAARFAFAFVDDDDDDDDAAARPLSDAPPVKGDTESVSWLRRVRASLSRRSLSCCQHLVGYRSDRYGSLKAGEEEERGSRHNCSSKYMTHCSRSSNGRGFAR